MHPQRRQLWPQTVVEIALQAAALLLAGQHQLFAAALQVVGYLRGIDDGARLLGDVIEQATLGGAKGFAGCAPGNQQIADLFRLVNQW